MPIPKPKPNEKQSDYISRCISFIINEGTTPNTPDGRKQAAAICHSQWTKSKGERNKMTTGEKKLRRMTAEFVTTEHGNIKNLKATTEGKHPMVAIVGNRFMNGEFVPANELEKIYTKWNGKYHNLNHGRNFNGNIMIQEIVGVHTDATYDKDTNSVLLKIIEGEHTKEYQAWKGFLDLNQKAKKPTNVSVEFWCNTQKTPYKDLKPYISEDDVKKYDLKDDTEIPTIIDIEPKACATVDIGAGGDDCSYQQPYRINTEEPDTDTAGFTTEYIDLTNYPDGDGDEPPVDPNIKKQNDRIKYLQKRIKKLATGGKTST